MADDDEEAARDRAAKKAVARRLGAALRRVREQAQVSGAELGRRIGVKQGTVSQWESGRKLLQLHYIERAEDALDVTRGAILAEAGFMSNPTAAIRTAIADDENLVPHEREMMVQQLDLSWLRSQAASSHASSDGDAVGNH